MKIYIKYNNFKDFKLTYIDNFEFENSQFSENIYLEDRDIKLKFYDDNKIQIINSNEEKVFHSNINKFWSYDVKKTNLIDINDFIDGSELPTFTDFYSMKFINESKNIFYQDMRLFDIEFNSIRKRLLNSLKRQKILSTNNKKFIKCKIKNYEHNKNKGTITIIINNFAFEKDDTIYLTLPFPKTWDESNELIQLTEKFGHGSLDSIKDEYVYIHNKQIQHFKKSEYTYFESDCGFWFIFNKDIYEEEKKEQQNSAKGIINRFISILN